MFGHVDVGVWGQLMMERFDDISLKINNASDLLTWCVLSFVSLCWVL